MKMHRHLRSDENHSRVTRGRRKTVEKYHALLKVIRRNRPKLYNANKLGACGWDE
jgi:ribosomal protein S15P/S13E